MSLDELGPLCKEANASQSVACGEGALFTGRWALTVLKREWFIESQGLLSSSLCLGDCVPRVAGVIPFNVPPSQQLLVILSQSRYLR